MTEPGPTREELLRQVFVLEQRLQEAESTIAALQRRAAAVSGGAAEDGQRLTAELENANAELQVQTEELRLQTEEMQTQAEELMAQNEELERLTQDLESERALLRTVLDQMPGGVIVAAAPSGRFLLANQQVAAILGGPVPFANSLENYAHFHGLHPDGRPYQPQDYPLARCLTMGETICEEEIAIIRDDGSRGVIQVNAAPARNRRGEIVAAVATYRNITARIARPRFLY
jgi:PAS domain S-box-containing protein